MLLFQEELPMSLNNQPSSYAMSLPQFDQWLEVVGRDSLILAPVRLAHRGRFSDTDAVRYAPIRSIAEIEYRRKSDFSAKEIVFPINQTLFHFDQDRQTEPAAESTPILLLARACDINAFDRLDDIFLRNGPHADPYYQRLRQRIRFILMECAESFENCFCVSMGCNRVDQYAMAVRFEAEGVRVHMRDEQLARSLPSTARACDFVPGFITQDTQPVQVPDVQKIEHAARQRGLFNHDMWKEYSKRCIACGRCNTHCPTCSCFTTFDVDGDARSPRTCLGQTVAENRRSCASL
jgi:anaerobic sulfite reductase subunit A